MAINWNEAMIDEIVARVVSEMKPDTSASVKTWDATQ